MYFCKIIIFSSISRFNFYYIDDIINIALDDDISEKNKNDFFFNDKIKKTTTTCFQSQRKCVTK